MENYEKYAEFTKTEDWAGLCQMNGVELDSFGTKKELRVLPEYLESNEVVFALTSGIMDQSETSNALDFGTNTWLVALTSDRFLFLDSAMLTNSVDTQSIRHNRVQAVSASQGLMLGKITVDLGSRMLVIDNCQKATVKVVANIANKWLKELEDKEGQTQPLSERMPVSTLFEKLELLEKLYIMGGLTEDEYNNAKNTAFSSNAFKSEKEKLLTSFS